MILVYGATGNIGKCLVPILVQKGEKVRVFTRNLKKTANFDQSVEKFQGDLNDVKSIADSMKNIDSIFLIAFNKEQVQNVVAEAKKSGVKKIVYISTQVAGTNPPTGQGVWHRKQEMIIENSGIPFSYVRPTMMMTNTLQWVNEIKTRNSVTFPGGKGKIPPVDPIDVAKVSSVLLTNDGFTGKNFEVTGPELLTIGEMVTIISQLTNKTINYNDITEDEFGNNLRSYKISENVITGLIETFKNIRTNRFAYATSTVKNITGETPRDYKTWCSENLTNFIG